MNRYSSNEVLKLISGKSKEMNAFLNTESVSPALRERLQDQLVWLKSQVEKQEIDYDPFDIADRFNWVVENFNTSLNLPEEERFNYFSELEH
ncbi:MAG: hypothetical protein K9M13_03865 [Simkaniaceae bacterium]|nr:hypothetical protein [Simkaniaceae bacterium]